MPTHGLVLSVGMDKAFGILCVRVPRNASTNEQSIRLLVRRIAELWSLAYMQ